MTKMTEEMVRSYFPQLSEIKNQEYAKKAAEIWVEAFENSSWENIADAQFATRAPGVALVKHTESVTANALMIARNTVEKYGYEIAYEEDTYAETLMDVDDTYKVLNGELYKCDDTQYPEDTSYLVDVRSNGDGTYEYIAQFYNGGTWLNEVLEEGLNNLK